MSKPESHVSKETLPELVSREDLRAAHELAYSLVVDNPRSRYSAFTNSSTLQKWAADKSEDISRLMLIGSADPDNTEIAVKEIVGMTIIEAFLVAYTLLSKINAASAVGDSGAIQPEDFLKLELWERGLLSPKFYRFAVKGDKYLARVKESHRAATALINRVRRMKSVTEDKRASRTAL